MVMEVQLGDRQGAARCSRLRRSQRMKTRFRRWHRRSMMTLDVIEQFWLTDKHDVKQWVGGGYWPITAKGCDCSAANRHGDERREGTVHRGVWCDLWNTQTAEHG